jgi:hypothetical protein
MILYVVLSIILLAIPFSWFLWIVHKRGNMRIFLISALIASACVAYLLLTTFMIFKAAQHYQ